MSMEMNKALDLLRGLVSEVERKTCCHEETHRGGAIWEICDSCGAKWADDEGGKPEFAWPESVEKARAFLATHPAVEQVGGDERASKPGLFCRDCGSRLMVRGVCSIYCPNCVKAQVKQAEAERPEVVARVVHSNPVVLGQCGPLNANDELMTVAQHAASVARWAEMFNRVEQQRDAALARVAELERQVPVAWMHDQPNRVDVIHRDVKDLLQRVPGSSRGIHRPLDVSEHYTIPLYAGPVAQAQQLHDLDKQCRDDVARALGLRPNQERGFAWSYLLASIKSCVKASGDSAQAQHSVPDVCDGKEQDAFEQWAKKEGLDTSCHPMHWLFLDAKTNSARQGWKAALRYVRAQVAAPGKSVPQAWLDVLAERRRQVEAEGWTPEHDDLYCAAELPRAAAAYILSGANDEAPAIWPFLAKWWKPRDARANYMRAGALILAEIERLDRAAAPGKEGV